MKRFYYHGEVYIEQGRGVCSLCGNEVDNLLLSEIPCAIPTSYYTVFDELEEYSDVFWIIKVSNFRAALLAGRPAGAGIHHSIVEIKDKYLAEQLESILLASVEANGGAINISGLYGISEDLANVLKKWLIEKKIILANL